MTTSADFWENRYASASAVWSGRVNQPLADLVRTLQPGTALDLGCGEGGDAIWLAEAGWIVTGVDISHTAVARAAEASVSRDLPTGRAKFVAADIQDWVTAAEDHYDLVVASFLQSPIGLDRESVLRKAAGLVSVGGHLILISHAAPPPWMTGHRAPTDFPQPATEMSMLRLPESHWETVIAEIRERDVTTSAGEQATLMDTVVMVRRIK